LLSYLGLTLISISINAGQLTIVVSGRFTLALVTNHNGQYLINTPCHAKTVSTAMEDIIRAVLSKLGLTLISASINKGSLIIVCRKDTAVPPPLVMSVMFTYAYQRGNALVLFLMTLVIVNMPTPLVYKTLTPFILNSMKRLVPLNAISVVTLMCNTVLLNMTTGVVANMPTLLVANMMFYAYQRGNALMCCLSVVHAHLSNYSLGTCQNYMWCLGLSVYNAFQLKVVVMLMATYEVLCGTWCESLVRAALCAIM